MNATRYALIVITAIAAALSAAPVLANNTKESLIKSARESSRRLVSALS
ncbi:hypothetical protein [Cupriavidus sp. AcVe19-6a]|nr:hypothetical protein [Cupriavidus sp. AcVe19-6a]MBP0639726.1 hypothetical protein [Cupriavidus sp. AcVe19-6a]